MFPGNTLWRPELFIQLFEFLSLALDYPIQNR